MSDIAASIRERLAELDDERARLGLALLALEGLSDEELDESLPTHPRRRRRGSTRTRAVSLERALQTIAESPGASTTDVIKRIGGDRNQLLALLKEAEADGQLRREGTRAATRWLPVEVEAAPAGEPTVPSGSDDH